MKNLIFLVVSLLFVGASYAADPNPPPAETVNTFEEVIQVNDALTAQGWDIVDVFQMDHVTGKFILLKYSQDCRAPIAYCSAVIQEFTEQSFQDTREAILNKGNAPPDDTKESKPITATKTESANGTAGGNPGRR